jgi:hypothetical protein
MSDWWKNPVLQGPENDYGDYDYLVEELPKDHCGWDLQRYTSRCDSCGNESHLLFRATHYFYCYDGWDSHTYTECWKCMVKGKIYSIKYKFKKRIKAFKTAMELYKISRQHAWNFKKCYDMALKFER